jgi:hypothetical protein
MDKPLIKNTTVKASTLFAVRERMREGTRACRDILKDLYLTPIERRIDRFQVEFDGILRIMGRILFEATEPFLQKQWKRHNLNFYFWPGYVSILADEESSRITLSQGSVSCGQGFRITNQPLERIGYLPSSTSTWYARVLTPEADASTNGANFFVPGGTHNWVSAGSLAINSNAKRETLFILEICVARKYAFDSRSGIIRIHLKAGDWENWGQKIGEYLNDSDKVHSDSAVSWPHPIPPDGTMSGEEVQVVKEVREKLYSIWLAATFDSGWARSHREWLLAFSKRLTGEYTNRTGGGIDFSPLAKRLVQDVEQEGGSPEFRCWYTLPLESAVHMSDAWRELGSAMILSSCELPAAYLHVAASWVTRIYLSLRYFENATLLDQARKNQMEMVFAHEIKQIGHALSKGLIITPSDELREGASKIAENAPWTREDWGIAPFPGLIDAAGKVIKLWCGHDNPNDVFPVRSKPKNTTELIGACWSIARDTLKPHACKSIDLNQPSEVIRAKEILTGIDKIWGDETLEIDVSSSVPSPDWRRGSRDKWMFMTRFLVSSLMNCIRHGSVQNKHYVKVTADKDNLFLTIKGTKAARGETLPLELALDVRAAIESARKKIVITPLASVTSGEKVQDEIAHYLKGEVYRSNLEPEPGEPYDVTLRVPLDYLLKYEEDPVI